MFSMYNQAVPNLACPQHTIRQFTTYVCNVQSGSSDFPCSQCTIRQFPTSHAPIYNLAASDLPCSQYTVPDLISSQGTIIRQYALNIAVPNLPCSQCTIWQFPTSQQVTPFRLISSHGQSTNLDLSTWEPSTHLGTSTSVAKLSRLDMFTYRDLLVPAAKSTHLDLSARRPGTPVLMYLLQCPSQPIQTYGLWQPSRPV